MPTPIPNYRLEKLELRWLTKMNQDLYQSQRRKPQWNQDLWAKKNKWLLGTKPTYLAQFQKPNNLLNAIYPVFNEIFQE